MFYDCIQADLENSICYLHQLNYKLTKQNRRIAVFNFKKQYAVYICIADEMLHDFLCGAMRYTKRDNYLTSSDLQEPHANS